MLGLPEAGLNYAAQLKTNEANLQIANATNQANVAMTRETNAANIRMNAENNALQQKLANQAYERSTASNQIAELIRAGYTQQQAMQAVLGNGDAASMPMPTTQPGVATAPQEQMPSPLVAPQLNDPTAGALESSIYGALTNSLGAKDGGSLGWMVAQDYITQIMDAVDEGVISPDNIPSSPADLLKLYNSLSEEDSARSKIKSILDSDACKKVKRFVPAQRAAYNYFSENLAFKSQTQQIQESIARTNAAAAAQRLTEIQITGVGLDNTLKGLNIDYQRTQNEIAKMLVDYQTSQNLIAANEAEISALNKEIMERTSPYLIEETIGRAQNALAQYEIDFAYKRMNQAQIREAMEKDLDLQIAYSLAQKVVQENIENSESAFAEEAFKEDGTMKGIYRMYGAFKRFGVGVVGDAATVAGTGAGVAAVVSKIIKKH